MIPSWGVHFPHDLDNDDSKCAARAQRNFPYTTLLAQEGYSVIGVAGKTGWDDEMSKPQFDHDEFVVCGVVALCLGNAALGIIYRLMA